MFENVQKHSGIISPGIQLLVAESEGQIRISITSEVSPEVDISEATNRVSRIKEIISEGSYQRGARSEGGTGLLKLRKIIGQSVKRPRHLDFGFADDRHFFVELELPFREIQT